MSKFVNQCIHSYMSLVSAHAQESKSEPKTGKESQKSGHGPISLVAVQSVWNELLTAMSALGINLVQNFIKIYSPESPPAHATASGSHGPKDKHGHHLSHFRVDTQMSNAERLKLFFKADGFNEIELFVQMMTLSYRKACRLKLLKYSRHKYTSSVETSQEDNNNPVVTLTNLVPRLPSTIGSESSCSTSEGTNDHHELENIINTNNENEVDVEIEDEDHSVSDFMTTEDEDDPDDDDVDDEGEVEADNHSADVDDEPILGKGVEAVLSPPESDKTGIDSNNANIKGKERDDRKCSEKANDAVEILVEEFIRDKSCPHGVCTVFHCLNYEI